MAQDSLVSSTRPAVLVATGLAAAFGIFCIYNYRNSTQTIQNGLQRSNAVHRSRGERPRGERPRGERPRGDLERNQPRVMLSWSADENIAPLGAITISRPRSPTFSLALPSPGYPLIEEIQEQYGFLPDGFRQEIERTAVYGTLQACLRAQTNPAARQTLEGLGLGSLISAIEEHDQQRISNSYRTVCSVLGEFCIDSWQRALRMFMETESRMAGDSSRSNRNNDFAETEIGTTDGVDEPSQGLKALLYHIAEQEAKRKAYEHRGFHCEECNEWPIRGIRWHCLNCPDYDLCSTCEADSRHPRTHVFAKIKIPLPALSQPKKDFHPWYPGDSRKIHPPLDPALGKALAEKYKFEAPQMDAMYDQFLSFSDIPWPADPSNIGAGIHPNAFRKALSSERWPHRHRPNALYDRMFAFYDTNEDSIIGFEEFIGGLAYLRGPDRFKSLERAFNGFDFNGDGFIDRADVIRLLRAKHEIHKLMIDDMITSHEHEQTQTAMETIRSSQPISSVFSAEEIPRGQERPPQRKPLDRYGDAQPEGNTKTVLDDDEGWVAEPGRKRRRRHRRSGAHGRGEQRLQEHLSRFEELLENPLGDGRRIPVSSPSIDGSPSESSYSDHDSARHTGEEVEVDQDVLWQVIADGFDEMLDPLFAEREEEDRQVVATTGERRRWCDEIEEADERRKVFRDELQAGAKIDPLLAAALQSSGSSTNRMPFSSSHLNQLVPTDDAALERLEANIAQQPLEELLSATGYGTVEDEQNLTNGTGEGRDIEAFPAGPASATEVNEETSTVDTSADIMFGDPTMPQNRPNTSVPGHGGEKRSASLQPSKGLAKNIAKEECLSIERLEQLVKLNEAEKELERRGGPGRLSFNEVETIVKNDKSGDLKGLIKGWLEWAAF